MWFNKMVKDWFTGIDGVTYDPARFLWILGMFLFLAFVSYNVFVMKKDFDMVNFSLSYGGLLAAGAAGVKIKETTEPVYTSKPVSRTYQSSPIEDDDPSLKPPKG